MKSDLDNYEQYPLEPKSYQNGSDGTTRDSRYSSAISLRRIADALEQLVLFHLGTGEQ